MAIENARASEPKAEVAPRIWKMSRRLGEDAVAAIARRYEAGEHVKELAAEYNVARSSLTELLRSRGVKVRQQPMPQADIDSAIALYRMGLSVRAVADQLGRPVETTRRALVETGTFMRQRGGRR